MLIIERIPVGELAVNTYIVVCRQTKRGVLIDPAGENGKILAVIEKMGVRIEYVLNTHGHADHVAGNAGMKEALSVPVCMHEADADFFSEPADIRLKHGDILEVGELRIRVIHTPGHTPGSVCFLVGDHLFSGDTLFVGAAGSTDHAGGSLDTLLESLEKKIMVLPGDTTVWPGHDYGDTPTSTIRREIRENIYIADFILADPEP